MRKYRFGILNVGGTVTCAGEKPYRPVKSAEELFDGVKVPAQADIELIDFRLKPDSTKMRHALRIEQAEFMAERYYDFDAWFVLQGTDSLARSGGAQTMIWRNSFQVPGLIEGTQFTKDEAGSEVRLSLENGLRWLVVACRLGIVGWYNHCIGKIWRLSRLVKRNESDYDAFHEPGCSPVACTHPDIVLQGGHWTRDEALYQAGPKLHTDMATHVNTLDAYADAPPFPLIDMLRAGRKVDGVILRCEGCGNIPDNPWEDEFGSEKVSWIDAIRMATEKGIPVGILSPFEDGCVDLTRYELGAAAAKAGAISMASLTQPTGDIKFRQGIVQFGSDRAALEQFLATDLMRELLPRQIQVDIV